MAEATKRLYKGMLEEKTRAERNKSKSLTELEKQLNLHGSLG